MELQVNNSQNVAIIKAHTVKDLVDSFIISQDVKQSSKDLYRRTLKQFFNWVDKKNYLLPDIARPQILEYKEYLISSRIKSLNGIVNLIGTEEDSGESLEDLQAKVQVLTNMLEML